MPHPGPMVVKVPAGRHAICACGKTKTAPFCDASHRGSGMSPVLLEAGPEGRNVAWCLCRTSGAMPFCNGNHKTLP